MKMTLEKIMNSVDTFADYFSTLTGYTTLCRLVQDDTNVELLKRIFEIGKINYCFIMMQKKDHSYVTDILKEALNAIAFRNARLIITYLRRSITNQGIQHGAMILLENRSLIAQHHL